MKNSKIIKHVKGDIKTFKEEAKEDRKLLKSLKHKKSKKKDSKESGEKSKFKKVMHEWKEGELHSGSKKGPVVTNPKQALAISFSEARKASKKSKK
jgi:hypothetical protein